MASIGEAAGEPTRAMAFPVGELIDGGVMMCRHAQARALTKHGRRSRGHIWKQYVTFIM
jgi:hypothetical protein